MEQPTRPHLTPDVHRFSLVKQLARLITVLAFFFCLLSMAFVFSALLYQLASLQRIYPGVRVEALNLGGLTVSQANEQLAQQAAGYLDRTITFTDGDKRWSYTIQQLGGQLDAERTAAIAYAYGRNDGLPANLLAQAGALDHGQAITPIITYDTGLIDTVLDQLGRQVNRQPRNARLVIHPDLKVEVIPAQTGVSLDQKKLKDDVLLALAAEGGAVIPLAKTETVPQIAESEEARKSAEQLLAKGLLFRFDHNRDKREWLLNGPQVRDMLVVGETAGADGRGIVSIAPDNEKFTAFLKQLAGEINQDVVEARFDFNPETGALTVTKPSQQGLELDVPKALEIVTAEVKHPAGVIALPVTISDPKVRMEDSPNFGIKELVSEATSYFKGSAPGRITNIRVSAEKFNGIVVAPGEVFSFDRYLGEVTAANGFEDSLIIQGDRTAVGIGGGVCQVSTTAFRAAFFGGFEIVERWAHGYRVSWYEKGFGPGLDATIYSPRVDLKFRNDTPSYILIETETNEKEGTLSFRFYGTKTGRLVEIDGPTEANVVPHGPDIYQKDPSLPEGKVKQVDWAVDGVDVVVTREVKEGEKIIHKDRIFSRYEPWQAIYLVGNATGG
jgi:vancomycin resistance protein YoaR